MLRFKHERGVNWPLMTFTIIIKIMKYLCIRKNCLRSILGVGTISRQEKLTDTISKINEGV